MPTSPGLAHADPQKARILRMLQGGDDAYGFRFLTPRVIHGKLKDRGFQKPDFLAFRANNGVVGKSVPQIAGIRRGFSLTTGSWICSASSRKRSAHWRMRRSVGPFRGMGCNGAPRTSTHRKDPCDPR